MCRVAGDTSNQSAVECFLVDAVIYVRHNPLVTLRAKRIDLHAAERNDSLHNVCLAVTRYAREMFVSYHLSRMGGLEERLLRRVTRYALGIDYDIGGWFYIVTPMTRPAFDR